MKSENFCLFLHNKDKYTLFIVLFLVSICSPKQIQILTEDTMRNIFNNNRKTVIYVAQQENPDVYQAFTNFCFQHSCAYLNVLVQKSKKNNELYQNIRNFVSHPSPNFLLILDAQKQLKYVRQIINNNIQYKDIEKFESDFTSQRLEPFFSSEQQPTQDNERCRKIVGKNFDKFLALEAPIKVVYLYAQQEKCDVCRQILGEFTQIAEKFYRDDVIAFGYFDIFQNDHPKIPSEIAPYFLVFIQNQKQPYGIEGQKFAQLQTALVNIIAEQIYPNYRQQDRPEDSLQIQFSNLESIQDFIQSQTEQISVDNIQL